MDAQLRWMIRRDKPEVMQIENSTVNPWTEDEMTNYLRQRNCIGKVCEMNHRVAGFMVYELHKDKLCLKRLAVRDDVRWIGIGTLLLQSIVDKLSIQRRNEAFFVVGESNYPMQCLGRKCGFICTDILRDFHDDEDGYFMSYKIGRENPPFRPKNRISGILGKTDLP